jgi:hypothetical protein
VGDRSGQTGEHLLDVVEPGDGARGRAIDRGGAGGDELQGERVPGTAQLQHEAVKPGGGAMLDGEAQAGALAAQVEVGVTPGVQLGALAGMVDEEDGAVEVALEVARIGEQGGDLGGGIFIEAMQAHKGIEDEERGAQGLDGGAQARLIAGGDPGEGWER